MTKKDYIAIASVIYGRVKSDKNDYQTLIHVTRELARIFFQDNKRFDVGKFVDTCGLGDVALPYWTSEEWQGLNSR